MRALIALPILMTVLAGCGAENKSDEDKSNPAASQSIPDGVSQVTLRLPGMV